MKKTTVSILLLFIVSVTFAQTIRRVNANPAVTGTNVYNTLQAAHNAADPNDIVIIEASAVSCGNLLAVKPLKIYGKGYFTHVNSDLNISPNPSQAGDIEFDQASSNSEISGVTCPNLKIHGASNIRVYRNNITNRMDVNSVNKASVNTAVSNIQVSQNYIRDFYDYTNGAGIFTLVITNNYLRVVEVDYGNVTGLVVNNNVIESTVSILNATFQNNILIYNFTGSFTATTSTVENNVALQNRLPVGGGNQNILLTDLNTLHFEVAIGAALPAGTSEDERWKLKATSTLKTAGTSSSEVGMYGGPNPYVPSGMPAAPSIIKLLTPDYGNTASPLPVTISVKSNN